METTDLETPFSLAKKKKETKYMRWAKPEIQKRDKASLMKTLTLYPRFFMATSIFDGWLLAQAADDALLWFRFFECD